MLDIVESLTPESGAIDAGEHVVLLDDRGHPSGTMSKSLVHNEHTPLHLAFSCHVVRTDGRVLITRRSPRKHTWPGVWTNACCGHPRLDETMREAVQRHLASELGTFASRLAVVLDDFTYRAEMSNRIVEHEVCPVLVAELAGEPVLNPDEADDSEWVDWDELRRRVRDRPTSLSPWVVEQIRRMPSSARSLLDLLDVPTNGATTQRLDRRIELPRPAVRGGSAPIRSSQVIEAVRPAVDDELRRFLDVRLAELAQIDRSALELGTAVENLVMAGGKRLRPSFVHWGWRAAAHPDERTIDPVAERATIAAGAAMELLHTFALLHDDVMDRSTTRRGRPSAHVAFAARHRAGALHGDSDTFGTNAATLAGDLAFVWADQIFDSIEISPDRLRCARAVYTTLRTEVIAGQFLDLLGSVDGRPADEQAITVALLKSARYTVTRPLQLGAALTGRPVSDALGIYGDAVGLAFQLRDDILDVFGDPAVTGKGRWNDIREGKRTLLLARALQLANAADRQHLLRHVGDAEVSDDDADRCRHIMSKCGALASVEALIDAQRAIADDALLRFDDPDARRALADLAEFTIDHTPTF